MCTRIEYLVPRAHLSPYTKWHFGVWIGSAISAGFIIVTNRQTDHVTPSVETGRIPCCVCNALWRHKHKLGINTCHQWWTLTAFLSTVHAGLYKKIKVAHTRLPSAGFRSWSRFLAVSLQVMWVIKSSRLLLLSARPAVTFATLKRAATNFAAWWTEAWWVWTVSLRLLPDSVVAASWIQALLRLSPAC